jgi:hypothetical protein
MKNWSAFLAFPLSDSVLENDGHVVADLRTQPSCWRAAFEELEERRPENFETLTFCAARFARGQRPPAVFNTVIARLEDLRPRSACATTRALSEFVFHCIFERGNR